jgi:TRAP transporter TAXI family solute receptor
MLIRSWISRFLFIVLVFTCFGQVANAQSRYTIGSSPPGGAWYPMAAGLAEIWNQNIPGITVTVEGTGGAAVNPRWLANREVDFSLTTLDMIFAAREGSDPYDREYDLSHVHTIMLQHSSPSFVVVLERSGIRTFDDLRGKRIAVGSRGVAANQRAVWFLEAHGIDASEVRLEYVGDDQAAGALGDGRIDAWIEFVGVPAPAVMSLAATHDIHFLDLEDDAVERLRETWPFMVPTTIPAGTYSGQEEDYVGFGVTGALMVLDTVPEEVVYEACMAIHNNRDALASIHQAFTIWEFDADIETITGQSLHPGAERCYSEIGIQ